MKVIIIEEGRRRELIERTFFQAAIKAFALNLFLLLLFIAENLSKSSIKYNLIISF